MQLVSSKVRRHAQITNIHLTDVTGLRVEFEAGDSQAKILCNRLMDAFGFPYPHYTVYAHKAADLEAEVQRLTKELVEANDALATLKAATAEQNSSPAVLNLAPNTEVRTASLAAIATSVIEDKERLLYVDVEVQFGTELIGQRFVVEEELDQILDCEEKGISNVVRVSRVSRVVKPEVTP